MRSQEMNTPVLKELLSNPRPWASLTKSELLGFFNSLPPADKEALDAFHLCGRLEGILPALETAHALVEAVRVAAVRPAGDAVVVCFSGRGDKDCAEVARLTGGEKGG